jgi:hypothetical protein
VPAGPAAAERGHLVPGAEARALAVDDERQLDRIREREAAVGITPGEGSERLVEPGPPQRLRVGPLPQGARELQEARPVAAGRTGGGRLDECRPGKRCHADVLRVTRGAQSWHHDRNPSTHAVTG